jgi:hypothetical protein
MTRFAARATHVRLPFGPTSVGGWERNSIRCADRIGVLGSTVLAGVAVDSWDRMSSAA